MNSSNVKFDYEDDYFSVYWIQQVEGPLMDYDDPKSKSKSKQETMKQLWIAYSGS